jgi:pyruvate formate lyase activating enzyme
MKLEALLYDRLEGNAVGCRVCQWHCRIGEGKSGICRTRVNESGTLYTLIYGEVSFVAVDPIEKKPLFHFFPTSRVFSLGTWGCNFHCKHCQNWQLSYAVPSAGGWSAEGTVLGHGRQITPRASVEMALSHGCAGIAWTYNEPGIWLEHTLESAQLAREAGLYTVYVTNGYLSAESLDAIGPYLDAYRVDIKGFGAEPYRDLAGVPRPEGILEVAERARHRWGMHVEVVTNLVSGLNDDPVQVAAIARWIRDALGPETPWHLTRSFPQAEMSDGSPTPVGTVLRAREIGLREGLSFVYPGNMPGGDAENTRCPGCGATAIRRSSYRAEIVAVAPGGSCAACGQALNLRGC